MCGNIARMDIINECEMLMEELAGKHAPIQTNKLRGFSPPANYTDRATAACRRIEG
jgi:hypothetical protein